MLRTVIVLLALVAGVCPRAAAAVPEIPLFRVLGVAQGLPSSSVNGLARDRAGYLWIATPDGLARYDGVGFRVWRHDPDDPASLPGNNVQALHVDAADRVWVATEGGGISVLDGGRDGFRHYRMAGHPEIGSDDTWAFASHDGVLWFGTYAGGLHRLGRDGRITRFTAREGDPRSLPADIVLSLAFDAGGTLWIGTTGGLARRDGNDGFERVSLPGENPAALVYSLAPDGDALWAGTAEGAFRRGSDGGWSTPSWSSMFARPNAMLSLAHDRDGRYWIGSQRGLWRTGADGVPTPVSPGGSRIAKGIQAVLLQPDGALWVPAAGQGIGYLRADWRRVAELSSDQGGLSGELYRALAPSRDGGLLLAGYTGVLERLSADGTLQRMASPSLQGLKGFAVAEDARGNVWLSDRSQLLRLGRDGRVLRWDAESAVDPVPSGQIDQLAVGPDGTIWLSAAGAGLQQRDAASGRVLREAMADPDGAFRSADVEAMVLDADGLPWVAGADGVLRMQRDGRLRTVVAPARGRVFGIGFDGAGGFWMHDLDGLSHYRRRHAAWQRTERVGVAQGLPAVESAGLRVDRLGRVWLATTRGLFRWDPRRSRLRRFGLQDGLGSQEFLDRALALTPGGMLAAGLANGGVALFDTVAEEGARAAPPLRIDSVAVRRRGKWQAFAPARAPVLASDDRELRVVARLLDYQDPQSNRYWSRLDGFDADWVAQGASGERIFSGLPAGGHLLHLRASGASGVAAVEQTLRFRVLPPWWRTAWARAGFALLALLAVLLVALAYRQRLHRRHEWQLAEQRRRMAEHASEAKTRFLATLGHEVRTPMTGVLGMGELLLGTRLDPAQRGYVNSIRRAGEHLLRLVDDALDLARIEAGRLELAVQPFDPRELVDEVVALMSPLAVRRGLLFRRDVDVDVPRALLGDPLRLKQVLLNLIGNAVKFTESGEVALRVSVPAAGGVRFEVADTGPGLNDEQAARIFRRFEQAEGARTTARYGGSGLGLAISQELAAAMGGTIAVDSTPGAGTRFAVELPLATAAAPASRATTQSRLLPAMRLLLVEDEPTVAEVIAGLLRAQGHEVVHAGHGLAALSEVATGRFDAGLLDLDLPGLDGLELARQLRAQGFAAPLVAVTARADPDAEPQARAAGFDGFVRKPVTGDMLAAVLESAHDRGRGDDRA